MTSPAGHRLSGSSLGRLLPHWRAAAAGASYVALAVAVRQLVLDGRLGVGVRLPAERDLAAALGLSRNTVTAAYNELRASGHVVSRHGSGTFVAVSASRGREQVGVSDVELDLALAAPEASPGSVERALAAAAELLPAELSRTGYDRQGLPALREAVAVRFTARGLPTHPDQIVISNGACGAFSLLGRVLIGAGDRALVDVPTWPGLIDTWRAAGARLSGVPLLDDGWDLDAVAAAHQQLVPRISCVVADFANPTGLLMDSRTRAGVVAAAQRGGGVLVVDETLVELYLDGQPMPLPMAAFSDDDRVVTVGSVSKSHWGGLRVGWVRAPRALAVQLAEARAALDLAPPVLDALVTAALLQDEQALAHRRATLASRRDAMVSALADRCADWRVSVPGGGLSLWVRLHAPVATALCAAAARQGVRLVPGGRFTLDGSAEHWLRLPYALPENQIREAVDRIAAARQDLQPDAETRSYAVA